MLLDGDDTDKRPQHACSHRIQRTRMTMDEYLGWYRRRSYAHFDRPISEAQARALVSNPKLVSRHAFWPVILNPQKSVSMKEEHGCRVWKTKICPIVFAAHSDSHVYAYYAKVLGKFLEEKYSLQGGEHVLAYRRFPRPRCNVHFALEAFEEIEKKESCDVIAIDVEGFFDSLNHQQLNLAWKRLLCKDRLPDDHYAVFKACTQDTAVTVPTLRDIFGGEIKRRTGISGEAICAPKEFRTLVKPYLRSRHKLVWEVKRKPAPAYLNGLPAGIPQGLPISAVLANLYFYDADLAIRESIRSLGGSYRRYSDDILLIVPKGQGTAAELIVQEELKKIRLKVNQEKTIRCRFSITNGVLRSVSVDQHFKERSLSSVAYLGFTFDGQHLRVRDSTIARFVIKAKRAIERARIAAVENGEYRLKKRQLYAQLTSLGYGQAYGSGVYNQTEGNILPKGAPRLGFFKYLRLAERVTDSAAVRKQIRQIENEVFREIDGAEKSLRNRPVPS